MSDDFTPTLFEQTQCLPGTSMAIKLVKLRNGMIRICVHRELSCTQTS